MKASDQVERVARTGGWPLLRAFVFLLCIPYTHAFARAPGGGAAPNIVFILTDDQGPWALGASGDANAVTPHIDRLRSQGALLASCYTPTPVCSPSRASLLTSRYGSEVGITDYIGTSNDTLSPFVLTWPKLLSENGYATGLVGKYHCGNSPESHPTRIGYKEFRGFLMAADSSRDPLLEIDGELRRMEGWTEDVLADLAMDFIRRHAHRPFALSLHFWAPHAQVYANADGDRTWLPLSDEDWAAVKNLDLKLPEPDYPDLDVIRNTRMLREYLGSVHSVDRNVGRIMALLEEMNLSENTVVIFTSDNGFNLGHHGIWHKGNGRWLLKSERSSRPNMWDNSLRVPAIVRWPSVVPAGSTVDKLVTFLDWFPTIAAIAGVKIPEGTVIRGRDVQPELKSQGVTEDREFFAQYSMRQGPDMRSYQTAQWKLVRYLDGSLPDEMYDRVADPAERVNLHGSDRADVRSALEDLSKKLTEAMQRINDPGRERATINRGRSIQ